MSEQHPDDRILDLHRRAKRNDYGRTKELLEAASFARKQLIADVMAWQSVDGRTVNQLIFRLHTLHLELPSGDMETDERVIDKIRSGR